MITPKINLNGNTKASLVEQAMAIHNALETVLKLVAESDLTHARNFQKTGDPLDYIKARAERTDQYQVLNDMSNAYFELAAAIASQS